MVRSGWMRRGIHTKPTNPLSIFFFTSIPSTWWFPGTHEWTMDASLSIGSLERKKKGDERILSYRSKPCLRLDRSGYVPWTNRIFPWFSKEGRVGIGGVYLWVFFLLKIPSERTNHGTTRASLVLGIGREEGRGGPVRNAMRERDPRDPRSDRFGREEQARRAPSAGASIGKGLRGTSRPSSIETHPALHADGSEETLRRRNRSDPLIEISCAAPKRW